MRGSGLSPRSHQSGAWAHGALPSNRTAFLHQLRSGQRRLVCGPHQPRRVDAGDASEALPRVAVEDDVRLEPQDLVAAMYGGAAAYGQGLRVGLGVR